MVSFPEGSIHPVSRQYFRFDPESHQRIQPGFAREPVQLKRHMASAVANWERPESVEKWAAEMNLDKDSQSFVNVLGVADRMDELRVVMFFRFLAVNDRLSRRAWIKAFREYVISSPDSDASQISVDTKHNVNAWDKSQPLPLEHGIEQALQHESNGLTTAVLQQYATELLSYPLPQDSLQIKQLSSTEKQYLVRTLADRTIFKPEILQPFYHLDDFSFGHLRKLFETFVNAVEHLRRNVKTVD